MIQNLRRLWDLLTSAERKKLFVVLAMAMAMAALETAGVLSIMPFLAVLGNPEIATEHRALRQVKEVLGFRDTTQFILALGVFSALVVTASSLYKSVTVHALNRFANLQRHSISSRLLNKYMRQPYSFFLGRNSADLSKNLLSEVDQLITNVLQPTIHMFAYVGVALAIVLLLLIYDPIMAVVVSAGVAFVYGTIYLGVRGILGRIGPERLKANSDRFLASSEALGAIKEVKVSGSTDVYLQRFHGPSRRLSRHTATNETLSQVPLYLVEAAGYAGLIAIALVLAYRGQHLGQVLPVLGLYGFAAYRLLPAAQIVYRCMARMRFGASSLEHIHRDLLLEEPHRHDACGVDDETPMLMQDEIHFHEVVFSYPGQAAPALRHITLSIPAKATIGIVGPTGSGKSTLVDVLLGLIAPQHGCVTIDKIPLTSSNTRNWQRSIGYAPQHVYIADSSIAENIAFGVDPSDIDHAAVERAARAAQLHEFVCNELPDSYRTQVGERGTRLSGGQRQRIGIARALYRDPAVLVLDEATNALDSLTEGAVMDALAALSTDKTVIMIAHRLHALVRCDRIFMISQGMLEGSGTFHELQRDSPRFRAMAREQSLSVETTAVR